MDYYSDDRSPKTHVQPRLLRRGSATSNDPNLPSLLPPPTLTPFRPSSFLLSPSAESRSTSQRASWQGIICKATPGPLPLVRLKKSSALMKAIVEAGVTRPEVSPGPQVDCEVEHISVQLRRLPGTMHHLDVPRT